MPHRRAMHLVAVAALFAVLAIAATWPLASDPAHRSLAGPFNNDFHFNTFVVMWGAHALSSGPVSLHHTNMFWPERYTFAYSDMSLAHSLLVLPVLQLSYNPTLAVNLLILASMVIGGVGAYLLGAHITGSAVAGLAGALLFVFNPAHFARHLQIQYFGDHWAPWLALALIVWMQRRTARWALLAALFFVLHALTGSHAAVFAALITVVLTATWAVRSAAWRRAWWWRGLALQALVVILVLGPIFYPYLLLQDRMAAERGDSPAALLEGSAHARDLLTGASRLYDWADAHWGWPSNWVPGRLSAHLFPGLVVLLLAAAGALWCRAPADSPRRPGDPIAWIVLLAICLLLALGPAWKVYDLLSLLPGVKLIRVPSRFLLPGLLALSMLAAYGTAAIQRRFGGRRAALVLATLAALFAFEARFAPLPTARVSGGPDEVNAWLATRPGDFAVLEIPVQVDNLTAHARQLLQSVFHWKKLLVGYSGWRSEEARQRLLRIESGFPDPDVLDELAQLQVRYVILVERRVPERLLGEMRASGRLELALQLDGISIWKLDEDPGS